MAQTSSSISGVDAVPTNIFKIHINQDTMQVTINDKRKTFIVAPVSIILHFTSHTEISICSTEQGTK